MTKRRLPPDRLPLAAHVATMLASPAMLFYVLPYFMLLVLAGTIAQKYIGVFPATHLFFNSFILWVGFFPLPGGALVLSIIFINLAAHFITKSQWRLTMLGTTLAHLGVLVLLLGGLLTLIDKSEGFVILRYGNATDKVFDYHERELALYKNDREIFTRDYADLLLGLVIHDPRLPFTLKVKEVLQNTAITKRTRRDRAAIGLAMGYGLKRLTPKRDDEMNQRGLVLDVIKSNKAHRFIATEFIGQPDIVLDDMRYTVILRRRSHDLPFSLSLQNFKQDVYPGTNLARAYQSDVILAHGKTRWPASIRMNHPLRYQGYTFYQSSVLALPSGETASVLNAVANKGWLFPYGGSLLVFLGLGWHAVTRWRMRGSLLLTVLLAFCAFPAQAAVLDMHFFDRIPVMHDGRIKPLGCLASLMQQTVTGEAPSDAASWLAYIFFDPAGASAEPFFRIVNPQVSFALGLDPAQAGYSFDTLNVAFIRHADLVLNLRTHEAAELTRDQQDLLDLYITTAFFEQLKNAFTAVLPLKMPGGDKKTYRNLTMSPSVSGEQERRLMRVLSAQGRQNDSLLILPSRNTGKTAWQSPWQAALQNTQRAELNLWARAALAYITHDSAAWHDTTRALMTASLKENGDPLLDFRLRAELYYDAVKPYAISLAFYALGLLALIPFLRLPATISFSLITAGFISHAGGLVTRMLILQRPPVSTLYESLIFVGAVAVALGIGLSWKKQNRIMLALTALAGVILQLVGFGIADVQDSFKPLQAVLNSNFWLGVHVVTITIGYALCLLTGLLAHIYLIGTSFLRFSFRTSDMLQKRAALLAIGALLFVACGTLLGGIWADQSWGRFWGWDPKENGALLITLWLVWLLHARLSGHVKELGLMLGLAVLTIITAFSWIGVNLLGIGLHSYGFIDGIAWGFGIYLFIECLVLGLCWRKLRHVSFA